jgi:hypothetical protein
MFGQEGLMRYRVLITLGALAVIFAVGSGTAVRVAGQTQKATAAKAYVAPRTADGRPDLSGVWSHNAATPFERPKELEGRQFLTDEEVAALKKSAAELFNGETDAAFGDSVFIAALKNAKTYQSRDGVTAEAPKGTGNYNQFWLVGREFDNRTSLIVDPPDGRLPPLTAEARKRQADAAEYSRLHYAEGPEDVPHNCYGGNAPMLGAGYNNYYQIVQGSDVVAIQLEMMHDSRIVPLGDRTPLLQTIPQRLGSSRGHWEGDTLVVETTNFKGGRFGNGGRGNSPTSQLTERFTRVSPTRLKYEVTVNDPGTYERPWTAVLYWRAEPKDQIFEFACHEGNEAMAGTLSGYRTQEKAASEAARRGSN